MLNMRRRLRKLERSRSVQPPAANPIVALALRQVSDQDLEELISVARDEEAGLCRPLSPRELTAEAAYEVALANVLKTVVPCE
jgi:hypothetical protein